MSVRGKTLGTIGSLNDYNVDFIENT